MEKLPPLPKSSGLYLIVLAVLACGFYAMLLGLLIGTLAVAVMLTFAAARLLLTHPLMIRLLIIAYAALGAFALAILKALFVRVGSDPPGIHADLLAHRKLFDLADEVARKVGAKRLTAIYLTPDDSCGVMEETAIYLPPGMGKRKLVIGIQLLNSLTTDQLRCVLAHEYAHFSNRDTYLGRFIQRAGVSYEEMVTQLAADNVSLFNPVCWLLRAYLWVYFRIAAAYYRTRELWADRLATEAYGRGPFLDALIAAHLESAYFINAGLPILMQARAQGQQINNVYHFIGVNRRVWPLQRPDRFERAWHSLFARNIDAFDLHPSLNERLKAQGMSPLQAKPPALPRVPSTPMLDSMLATDLLSLIQQGGPSAAEVLLGAEAIELQNRFSNLLLARCHFLRG